MKKNNPTLGIALGSGGARGLAHIGVIKTLIENDIPIDYISGTSIGALIGGIYSATKNIKKIESDAINIDLKQLISLMDPTMGKGFVEGTKIEKYIENKLGNLKFKDLKIPFIAIATDLNTGKPVLLKSGRVSKSIRASLSTPPLFKPVKINGRILTDGFLSMPIPLKIVKNMGADIVIAVNLDAKCFTKNMSYDKLSFRNIIKRSIKILNYNLSAHNIDCADIIIKPNVSEVRWSNFTNTKNLINEGVIATLDILPNLKKIIKNYKLLNK